MAKQLEELTDEKYLKETYLFYKSFVQNCRDVEDCKKFLKDLLTPSELRMLKRRWYIARLLALGKSIREVAHDADVSTATVVRVSQVLSDDTSMLKKALKSVENTSSISKSPKSFKRYSFGHE